MRRAISIFVISIVFMAPNDTNAGEREDYYICVSEEIGRGTDLAEIGDRCLRRVRPDVPEPVLERTPEPSPPSEEYPYEKTLRQILIDEGSFFDPISAQFKFLVYRRNTNAWCGQINAKNRLGGYVGWKYFALRDRYRGIGGRQDYIDLVVGPKETVAGACKSFQAYDRRYW